MLTNSMDAGRGRGEGGVRYEIYLKKKYLFTFKINTFVIPQKLIIRIKVDYVHKQFK